MIPSPGISSDWSDLTGYSNTSQCGSFLSFRLMACCVHAREREESTDDNFSVQRMYEIGLRKEQKTCLMNLALGKDVFPILPTGLAKA